MSSPNIASRFDEIYDSTSKTALALITAKCGRTADVGDIFQDTYVELYQVLSRRGAAYVTNAKALVMRIAKRKVAKYYSAAKRRGVSVPLTAKNEDGEETGFSAHAAEAFLTEDFALDRVTLAAARQFLDSKPESTQKVFYLMYDAGLSIPEIAQALRLSESNVKNKLYRTLKELRELLS